MWIWNCVQESTKKNHLIYITEVKELTFDIFFFEGGQDGVFPLALQNNKTSIQWTPGSQVYLSKKFKKFWSKMIFE